MTKFQISSLASLQKAGISVAFVAGNRSINDKNIKSKKESLEKFNCNLQPLMYVKAEKAIKDGCTIVDAITEDVIDEAKADSYIVILDGQHRFRAAMENKEFPLDNLYLYESYCDADTRDLLASSNIDTLPWNAHDFIHGAALAKSDEILNYIKELSDLGYSFTTIGEIMCFRSGVLTKSVYSKIMQKEDVDLSEVNIERAKLFLKVARTKFGDTFIGKKYLIRPIISLSVDYKFDNVAKAMEKLTTTQVISILKKKCHEKESFIRTVLEAYLKD